MKLAKTLLGTAFAIPSVVVPLTTLSSCGQNWGVLTPFTIGSSDRSSNYVYKNFNDYLDHDGNVMYDYLQSNYTIDQKNSTAYAYSQPMKFVDDEEKKQEDLDQWQPASSGWYQAGDADFVTTAVDKYIDDEGKQQSQNVSNARNSALSYNVTLVSSIASTINSYITNALSYQASQISIKDLEGKNLQKAWGADSKSAFVLDHGSKKDADPTKNDTFYEYNFALANANAGGAIKAMLKTSSVNFIFRSSMPFPSYVFNNGKITDFNDIFKSLIETNYNEPIYYTKKEEGKDEGDEGKEYEVYFYDSVPILIDVNSLTETYLNPSNKSNSFLVSDYYSTKDDIVKAVGNSWKNINSFTSDGYKAEPHFKSFAFKTNNSKAVTLPESHDNRLPEEQIHGNQFVVLLSYQVKRYKDGDHSKDTASLTGIQNIFPAYFLDVFKDEYTLFKKANNEEFSGYIIDQNEINKITVLFRQLFERTAGQGLLPIEKLNNTSKNLLAFLGYMFCSDDGQTVDTSFITTTDI